MHSIILFVFFIYALILIVNSQNIGNCVTPVNESGFCVPVKSCIFITNILENVPAPFPPKIYDYLQKSHCGFQNDEHYVCCASRHLAQTTTRRPITTTTPPNNNINIPNNNNNNDIQSHSNLRLLSHDRCGRITGDKLANGNVTNLGEFPWMVLLQYDTPTGLKFQCGASLISRRYVLTAAHCVTGIGDRLVSVRLGEHDISKVQDCENFDGEQYCQPPVQDIRIEEIRYHPNYNRPTRYANDVAVIRLARDAKFEENVEPICLPITEELQRKELDRVIISGWGTTEKGSASNELLKATINVIDNTQCQSIFKRSVRLLPSHMCAGGEGGVDSCKGDSGGPLFFSGNYRYSRTPVRYVQYGIISAGGIMCGNNNIPGLYTRVSHHLGWILDQMRP